MKIELIQIPNEEPDRTKTVGWNIIAETKEEQLILGSIRHAHFWAKTEDLIEYDGYIPDPEDDNYIGIIKYATKSYKKKKHDQFVTSLIDNANKSE